MYVFARSFLVDNIVSVNNGYKIFFLFCVAKRIWGRIQEQVNNVNCGEPIMYKV